MSKNDMKKHVSILSKSDLEDLVKTFRIPLDLHLCFLDSTYTMDRLPSDAICIYSEFLRFFGVCIPFTTFFLSVLKYFKKSKFFLIDRGAILDHLTWRHSHSCVFNDLPVDGYDQNDVEWLRVCLIRLRERREESDAKIVEEPHYISEPLLERVPTHTTAPAVEDALIPLPTPDEVVAAQPRGALHKTSKGPSQVRTRSALVTVFEPSQSSKKRRLKKRASKLFLRDEGTSIRDASVPKPRLSKRLGHPPLVVVARGSRPAHVGTSALAGYGLSLGAKDMRRQMDPLDALARSALSRDAEYDKIPKDDFGTATRGEEIELTLFPLAPGPYHMPYLYEGVSSPLYTKEEWDGPHAPECNILCKDIFKDPDVCRKALDQTITPAEFRRTESLLLLELSNRINVLSALLVYHGYELNSCYTDLVASKVRLQEKFDRKRGMLNCFVRRLLLWIKSLRRLLSSDEFHAALAHVGSLGINYGVKRGLHMGRTDADFDAAARKVSNFHIGAEGEFNKAFVAFPTTLFPFLGKVVAVAGVIMEYLVKISKKGRILELKRRHLKIIVMTTNTLFRFSMSASSFSLSDLWIVLLVRMPISTALVWPRTPDMSHSLISRCWHPDAYLARSIWPTADLCIGAVALSRIPFSVYSWIGVIQVHVASSIITLTSAVSTDRSLSSSTNTPFVSPSHCTDASLLKVSAFLISSLDMWLI
nr:hypothetical protein [Tanacetum cinerariifolium]